MTTSKEQFYSEQLKFHTEQFEIAQKNYRFYSICRFISFCLIPLCLYFFEWNKFIFCFVVADVVLFFYFVNKWQSAKNKKEKESLYIELNQSEINLIHGDWTSFPDGSKYKNQNHVYSSDMDLFGENSVFQYLNRTVLPRGEKQLAQFLTEGAKDIDLNQAMIQDFSNNIEWSQEFIVTSKLLFKSTEKSNSIEMLLHSHIKAPKFKLLRWVLSVITISSLIVYFLAWIDFFTLLIIGISSLMIISLYVKSLNEWVRKIDSTSNTIDILSEQVALFNAIDVNSNETKVFKKQLFEGYQVELGLNELKKIKKQTAYRMNVLVGLLLNYLFAWDLYLIEKSTNWIAQNNNKARIWESHLALVEANISGAVYQFNMSNSCFANFNENDVFEITGLSHPFVSSSKQVPNDFVLNEVNSIVVLTGPNMAGKSTYLRSVGLALLSANAGFPIYAKSCHIPKVQLLTSMRTSDDLVQNSSYFYAELKRLIFIMNQIQTHENTFLILDEILKGTNSQDKEIGSIKFLQKVARLGAKGIIATHDLSLTKLADDNAVFLNHYFDSSIIDGELYFNFKIEKGVCKNMNASFLLKKMDLID